ncbi:hypothetical protein phiOC_p144 [Ochrobactrum phage vB_OspM_OC]|nr:hypothetical protein phiOC_p144 [Ochrobactrum phage vB_OspM_OC]
MPLEEEYIETGDEQRVVRRKNVIVYQYFGLVDYHKRDYDYIDSDRKHVFDDETEAKQVFHLLRSVHNSGVAIGRAETKRKVKNVLADFKDALDKA